MGRGLRGGRRPDSNRYDIVLPRVFIARPLRPHDPPTQPLQLPAARGRPRPFRAGWRSNANLLWHPRTPRTPWEVMHSGAQDALSVILFRGPTRVVASGQTSRIWRAGAGSPLALFAIREATSPAGSPIRKRSSPAMTCPP